MFLPILLMLLGGLVEFGFALNQYINVVEAAREGARAGVDGDPAQRDLVAAGPKLVSRMDCDGSITGQVTRDYYAGVACRVISSARPLIFNPVNEDDIVITVVRVYHDPLCDVTPVPPATAIPDADCHANILPDPHGAWPWWTPVPPDTLPRAGSPGDSDYAGQWQLFGNQASLFGREDLQTLIDENNSRLSAGILIVEGFYSYRLLLNLPWIQPFIDPENDGIPFRTFTVIPLPAGEPRATPTPTPSPTPTFTPTNTSTPTFTPGPTSTPTPLPPTETPTETPTEPGAPTVTPVCNPWYTSSANSTLTFVTSRSWPDYGWADNTPSLRLQVLLVGECGEALAGRTVQLVSDRGGSVDTLTPDGVAGNLYFFTIASNAVGNSSLWAVTEVCPAADVNCAGRENATLISLPFVRPTGHFVCLLGTRDVSTSANTLQLMYSNPSPSTTFAWPPYMARRLVRLTVEYPVASPALQIASVSFGSSANIIWSGGPVTGPSASFGDGTSLTWTSFNRSIISAFRPLQINFTQPITPPSGSWTYRVTAVWDDTLGASLCTSEPVTITLP